jgi:hypothetical protein
MSNAVRGAYRKAGSDSVFTYDAGGAQFAFLDSIGGGGGILIDSVAIQRYGYGAAQNFRSWNAGGRAVAANGIASSGSTDAVNDSANILIGHKAGLSLTSGYGNQFISSRSALNATTGFMNIINGVNAASLGTLTGSYNIVYGSDLSSVGGFVGGTLAAGIGNIIMGGEIVSSGSAATAPVLTNGDDNIIMGRAAARGTTDGDYNVYIGFRAGAGNGTKNIVIGAQPNLMNMGATSSNTLVGADIGYNLTTGTLDAFGAGAGISFTTGLRNFALGSGAGGTGFGSSIIGNDNVFLGNQSGYIANSLGSESINRNSYLGNNAGKGTIDGGNDNVLIGYNAGTQNNLAAGFSGKNNIALGSNSLLPSLTLSNQVTVWVGASGGTGGYNALTRFTGGQWLLNNTTSSVTSAPNTSAALEINGTTGALIVPRLTTTQRDALTAAAGMIIFNTTTSKFQGYDGASWQDFH